VLNGAAAAHRKIGDRTAGSIPAESGVQLPTGRGDWPRNNRLWRRLACSGTAPAGGLAPESRFAAIVCKSTSKRSANSSVHERPSAVIPVVCRTECMAAVLSPSPRSSRSRPWSCQGFQTPTKKTAGGILLLTTAQEKPQVGEVVQSGPRQSRNDDGTARSPEVSVGDPGALQQVRRQPTSSCGGNDSCPASPKRTNPGRSFTEPQVPVRCPVRCSPLHPILSSETEFPMATRINL